VLSYVSLYIALIISAVLAGESQSYLSLSRFDFCVLLCYVVIIVGSILTTTDILTRCRVT